METATRAERIELIKSRYKQLSNKDVTEVLPTTFGDRLRELRARKKVSVRALARITAIGKSTIYQIEDGNRSPRLDQIQRIAQALNLAPTALVDGLS